MLLKMKTALGEPVDELRAEIDAMVEAESQRQLKDQQQDQLISEDRKAAFEGIFANLSKDLGRLIQEDKKKTAEQQDMVNQLGKLFETIAADPEVPQEFRNELIAVDEVPLAEVVEEVAPQKPLTLVERAANRVKKAPSMFVQPDPIPTSKDLQAIQSKLKLLEGWVGKISMAGPGGGEVLFRYLDDVARSTMTPANDNWVLEYDATTKKVQFTEDIGPIRTIKFNTTGYQTPLVAGQMGWNVEEDCLDIKQADGSTLQTGFEHYFQIHNNTGSTLLNGEVVMFSGVDIDSATNPIVEVSKYAAGPLATPLYLVGVMTNDVPSGGHGRATVFGKVRNLNTTGSSVGETWVRGDLLWAHPTIPGQLTRVRPTAPNVATSVAAVLRVGTTDGVILVRPTIWPRLFYGDWYDTTSQTAAAINTAYPVKMNSSGAVSGFSINAGGTVITALNAGRYNFEFSLQVTSSNSSASRIYIWYRKNGVDVPNSATVMTIASNGGKLAPAWNFPVLMEINDTFTLMWATDSTSVSLSAEAATAFCPSIPSVILTVSQTNL